MTLAFLSSAPFKVIPASPLSVPFRYIEPVLLITASDEFSSDSDSDTIVDTIHNFVVTAKILAEIADHTKDIKNIDLKNLSPADLSYMSLVLNRINEGFESRSNSSDTD